MAQEVREIKVLSVSFTDNGGGAANAAFRIQEGVNGLASGVHSRMFVKEKRTNSEDVVALASFLPHHVLYRALDWIASKVKNKIQHAKWNRYSNRSPLFMSDLRSTRIGGALEKLDYYVLHLHWINKRFVNLAELPKNKPIVWTLHDSWPFTGVCHVPYDCKGYEKECGSCPLLGSNQANDLSREVWCGKAAAYKDLNLHIVTPSRWLADCAKKSSLFRNVDIRVIPNCLDTETFSPGDRESACKKLGIDPSKRYILYGAVNALTDENKGFRYLKDAIEQTVWSEDVELIVIGANAQLPEMKNIKAHVYGYIGGEQLVAAYRAVDVMVVPSLSENLSCAIMEALSCGTPVCCFNIGGNGDMVEHQINGYLAKEKDCTDLAHGIQECITHSLEWGAAARESVVKKYAVDVVAKQYVELYKELTKNEK